MTVVCTVPILARAMAVPVMALMVFAMAYAFCVVEITACPHMPILYPPGVCPQGQVCAFDEPPALAVADVEKKVPNSASYLPPSGNKYSEGGIRPAPLLGKLNPRGFLMMLAFFTAHRWTLVTGALLLGAVFTYGIRVGSTSVLSSDLMVFHEGLGILALVVSLAAGVLSLDFVEHIRERHVVSVRTRTRLSRYLRRLAVRRATIAFTLTSVVVLLWYFSTLALPAVLGWDTNNGKYCAGSGSSAAQVDIQSSFLGPLIGVSPVLYAVVLAVMIGAWAAVATVTYCVCALWTPWPLVGLLIPFVATQLDNIVLGLMRLEAFRSMNLIAPWILSKVRLWEILPAAAFYLLIPIVLWALLARRRFEIGSLL